jgi:hypothetical protein
MNSEKLKIAIIEMLLIKAELNKLRIPKNKKSLQSYWDKKRDLWLDFCDVMDNCQDELILAIEMLSDKNKNIFCVMAMVGGPYYIHNEASLHVYKPRMGKFEVIFDSYIGNLNLWNDPCGIDNLKILANNL